MFNNPINNSSNSPVIPTITWIITITIFPILYNIHILSYIYPHEQFSWEWSNLDKIIAIPSWIKRRCLGWQVSRSTAAAPAMRNVSRPWMLRWPASCAARWWRNHVAGRCADLGDLGRRCVLFFTVNVFFICFFPQEKISVNQNQFSILHFVWGRNLNPHFGIILGSFGWSYINGILWIQNKRGSRYLAFFSCLLLFFWGGWGGLCIWLYM